MTIENHVPIDNDDFGFSAISAEEYESRITQAAAPIGDYKQRLSDVEDMILPFLQKLRDSGDKEYIYWPNRKEVINKQIDKLLKLTRE
jgi:uncharacterized protein (DUF3820 family)